MDADKNERREPLGSVEEIYNHAEELRETVSALPVEMTVASASVSRHRQARHAFLRTRDLPRQSVAPHAAGAHRFCA
jgi:hypothetical protein